MNPVQALHRKLLVLDSHCDTPCELYMGQDMGRRNARGHVDIPRLREGGVDTLFMAVYVSNSLDPDAATRRALELLSRIYDLLRDHPHDLVLVKSPAQARAAKAAGKIGLCIGMENGAPFQRDLSLLRLFQDMGVGYVTLTHNGNNEICDAAAAERKRWHGLSPFGRLVVAEMNRLGLLIDVAHISDQAFYDVLACSRKPVVSTHSCCRALCDVPRNMSDEMIRALAARGGVVQVTFCPAFLDKDYALASKPLMEAYDQAETLWKQDPETYGPAFEAAKAAGLALPRPSFTRVADHIDHVVSLVGVEHVGIGTDYDGIAYGPQGLDDVSCLPALTEELWRRGYKEEELGLILGGNFLRVLEEVQAQ